MAIFFGDIEYYNGYLYVGFEEGLYRRSELTGNWDNSPLNSLLDASEILILSLDLFYSISKDYLDVAYRSTNGGQDWDWIEIDNTIGYFYESYRLFQICDDKILAAGEDAYISSNDGYNWELLPEINYSDHYWKRKTDYSESDDILLSGSFNYLQYSEDCGENWTSVYDNLLSVMTEPDNIESVYIAGNTFFVQAGISDPTFYDTIYISNDLGQTWQYGHS